MQIRWLNNFFNKSSQVRNVYHPDYINKVEIAFSINGVSYFRFKDTKDTPNLRWFFYNWFLEQYDLGVTYESASIFVDRALSLLDKGKIIDAGSVLKIFKELINAKAKADLIYDLATVHYFTENEMLEEYLFSMNKEKKEIFKNSKDHGFFLTNPMKDIIEQLRSSPLDLEAFLSQVKLEEEIIKEINSIVLSQ
jgi:hypothetical protein